MKHYGDITQIKGSDVPPVDIIVGGSPCQDLSLAATERAGLQGERSGLFEEQMEGQVSIFDLDSKFGKTCQAHYSSTTEKILEQSSNKPQESSIVIPQFLDCRTERVGLMQGAFWEINGLSLGEYTTQSFGESPSAVVESRLLQILEDTPHPKHYLSERTSQGLLRRMEGRKEIPQDVLIPLTKQANLL